MAWPRAFRHFNPFEKPDQPRWDYDLIVDRAMRYLKNRSLEELQYGLETLHTLTLQYRSVGFSRVIEDERNQGKRELHVTEADYLRAAMEDFDISGQEKFPNATWPEYFALLALSHVGEAISTIKDMQPERDVFPVDSAFGSLILQMGIQGMDAIGEADALEREGRVRNETSGAVKQAVSERAAKAAKKRMAPYQELKDKCLNLYKDKYQSRSNREAARRIYENDLSAKEKDILKSDDPPHQIEIWIGAYRRSDRN